MTDKEFQALLNGKKVNWGSSDRARLAEERYKKRKDLPDEIVKRKNKKKKENG